MPPFRQIQDEALDLGRRNAEAMDLVRKHCSNARIERSPFGGFGLLEQVTGLPIGMHTVACEHAAKPPSFAAAEFLKVALSFYANNCVECPYRVLVGIPNLAMVAADVEAKRRSEEENRERTRQEAESAREARHRGREQRAMNESKPTRELVRLINLLDADEAAAEAGEDLSATIKAAPHLVTHTAAEILLEAAQTLSREPVLKAVRFAASAGRILPEDAVRVAIHVLRDDSPVEAARILLEHQAIVTAAQIAPARRLLITMAGRWSDPFISLSNHKEAKERWLIWGRAFKLLVGLDLVGVLGTIETMLGATSEYDRERAAAAAEVLVGSEPEVVPVLSAQLVAAVSRSEETDEFETEDSAVKAITSALARCLELDPRATQGSIESGAKMLTESRRRAVFDAYDNVIRRNDAGQKLRPGVGDAVLDACLNRIKGDWGEETRRSAYDTLELISKWQVQLLDGRVSALFALLLDEIGRHPLPLNTNGRKNPLAELDEMNRNAKRSAHIRDIREMIQNVARRRPQEVLGFLRTFLGSDSPPNDDAREMHANCVRMLACVGKDTRFLSDVTPLLYTAIVHADQLIRAHAVEALEEISRAHEQADLPGEFSTIFPSLLLDPYVIVHRAAVRALARGFPVRNEQFPEVISGCLNIAQVYAASGDDSDTLDEALTALLRMGRVGGDPDLQLTIDRIAARLAGKLNAHDLSRFLESHRFSMIGIPEYVETLVTALQDLRIINLPNDHDTNLRQILHRVPAPLLTSQAQGLKKAAMALMPKSPWTALEYVELLQRLGQWSEAVRLAEAIAAAIPKTVEAAVPRTYAEQVVAAARVEVGIEATSTELDHLAAASAASALAHARAKEAAKTRLPWLP